MKILQRAFCQRGKWFSSFIPKKDNYFRKFNMFKGQTTLERWWWAARTNGWSSVEEGNSGNRSACYCLHGSLAPCLTLNHVWVLQSVPCPQKNTMTPVSWPRDNLPRQELRRREKKIVLRLPHRGYQVTSLSHQLNVQHYLSILHVHVVLLVFVCMYLGAARHDMKGGPAHRQADQTDTQHWETHGTSVNSWD